MASDTEPAKLLLPYLQRADELQKHEPLVAYYCRLYAMERGLKIPQSERTKTTNALLISLMNQLEKDKKSLKLGPEDSLYLEGFALNVFGKADKQDRAGRADLNTAKTFYAASIFFEILTQLGPLHPELEQKQKYAVWKAADIRKALKEGREPTPGPPSGDDDLSVPSSTPGGTYDVRSSETAPISPRREFDPSPQFHNEVNDQHSPSIPPSHHFHDTVDNKHLTNISPPPQFHDNVNNQHPTNITSPPSYPSASFPPHDVHPPPPISRSESSTHYQPYHQESYPQEPPHHLPQNYPSHEPPPPYSYPNFQSYPSFSESTLPSVPSHHPTSYFQGSDTGYSSQPAPPPINYQRTAQYTSSSRNGTIPESTPPVTETSQYDSNYQPPPEKIAEAHKAARFAVGALAFDDVSVAVDFLKKSLELLTNPSAGGCFGESNTSKHKKPQVENHMQKLKMDRESECSTLEEWLIASPGLDRSMSSNNGGGEFVVFRQSSKKVHPSRLGPDTAENVSSNARNSFSKERLLKDHEKMGDCASSSSNIIDTHELCRSRSGKNKKKVSFRLPEEADILMFYSSGEV